MIHRSWLPAILAALSLSANAWAADIDPDALTIADLSFIAGVNADFVEAYKVFLKAKAGDQEPGGEVPTYGEAAPLFLAIAQAPPSPEIRAQSAWLGALCLYLDMDLPGAAAAAGIALEAAQPVPAGGMAEQVDRGEIKSLDELVANADSQVAVELAAIVATSRLTREAREQIRDYDLRTRLFDLGPDRDRIRTVAILADLFPSMAISQTQYMAKIEQALCAANLRRLGVCLHLYAQDHEGRFPAAYDSATKRIWETEILPYTGDQKWTERSDVWKCPAASTDGFSYGINQNITLRSSSFRAQGFRDRIANPHDIVLLADSVHYGPGDYPQKPNYGGAAYKIDYRKEHSGTGTVDLDRHEDGANILFVDGRVEWRRGLNALRWRD